MRINKMNYNKIIGIIGVSMFFIVPLILINDSSFVHGMLVLLSIPLVMGTLAYFVRLVIGKSTVKKDVNNFLGWIHK